MKLAPVLENLDNTLDQPASRALNIATPVLAFTGLALLWSQLGYLAPALSRPLGGLLWLIALALVPGKHRIWWVLAGAALLFAPWGAVHQGAGLWLLALLPWSAGPWGRRWMGAALLTATAGLIWSNFPGLWAPEDDFTSSLSHGLSQADLSFAASGLPLMLLAACFPLAALLVERRPFAPLIALGSLILTLPVYWALQRPAEAAFLKWGWQVVHDAFNMQWMLLILIAIVLGAWGLLNPPQPPLKRGVPEGRGDQKTSRTSQPFFFKQLKWMAPVLILFGALLVGLAPRVGRPNLSKQIVFLNKGYLNWDTPKYGNYGPHASGMFGLIPDYLRWRGFQVVMRDSLTSAALDSAGVVVIINLMHPLNPSEDEALHRFVASGGSLLLLGDHTGLAEIRDPSNRVLKPYGIELNFDTAKPLRTGWVGCMQCADHPLAAGFGLDRTSPAGSEAITEIWVGASLKVSPPAQPVILGRETWSDAGNPKNARDGYLGDFRYTINERLGDLALVAEAHSALGKALVFGDTSPLQNGALVRNGDWVVRMFRYLLSPSSPPSNALKILGVLLMLAGVASWVLSGAAGMVLAACSLALFAAGSFSQSRLISCVDCSEPTWTAQAPPRALLDHAHAPRTPLNQVSQSGHWGLQNTLMRSGFLPRVLDPWKARELDQARILLEQAPSAPFSKREIQDVTRFMQRGGLVIASCGTEEYDGSRNLLAAVGLQPLYVPLGPAEADTEVVLPADGDSVSGDVHKRLKVVFHKGWEVKVSNPNARSLLNGYGKPLVVFVPVGSGGLLYLPDTEFLANRNLEGTTDQYNEDNILFVRYLLRELAGGK